MSAPRWHSGSSRIHQPLSSPIALKSKLPPSYTPTIDAARECRGVGRGCVTNSPLKISPTTLSGRSNKSSYAATRFIGLAMVEILSMNNDVPYFTTYYTTRLRRNKPDAGIFHLACRNLGIAATDAVFVVDHHN